MALLCVLMSVFSSLLPRLGAQSNDGAIIRRAMTVSTDSTLTGNGLSSNPLHVVAGGGGGSSTLAIMNDGISGNGVNISSPTAIINFDSTYFNASLQGGATAYLTINYSTTGVTGNYTVVSTSSFVGANCSSVCTVTLPTAVGITGKVYTVKMDGSSNVTIATTSAQTIDGGSTALLNQQYTSLDLISNGTNWEIK